MRVQLCTILLGSLLAANTFSFPYKELVPRFDRRKSNAMVRKIAVPTKANLDFAAYSKNPVRYDPKKPRAKKPDEKKGLDDMTFKGYLVDVKDKLAETPLTDEEKDSPMAWKPIQDKVWEITKDDGWMKFASRIEGEKWADPNVIRPYQQIAAVYLHGEGEDTQIWAKVEFAPWVKFLEGISDEDEDEFDEVYGRFSLKEIPAESRAKAFEWIRTDYAKRVLNREQIVDWANILASYWYPTMNTDILEAGEKWPTEDTERKVRRQMRGVVVEDPIAVIRGRPFKEPIYNVYVVEGLEAKEKKEEEIVAVGDKTLDTSTSENFTDNTARFDEELEAHGGSYDKWAQENAEYLDGITKILTDLPEEQMGFAGKEDWVFFRKSLEYVAGGDLSDQPQDKNPIPHVKAFQEYLNDNGINMLYVVIPTKSDIYYEKLPAEMPDASDVIINPYSRKFLKDCQEAGIEVIDLLPHLLEAKAKDEENEENLYQHQDTHWTNRGLQIAAELIAERVKQYAWYDELSKRKVDYSVADTTFMRQGDIVDKLPEDIRANYPAVELKAQQVMTPEGKPYRGRGRKTAPVMLAGDSFTGVFELVDCKSAGVGSHIAAKSGLPVDIVTSWGGGPLVRQKAYNYDKRSQTMKHKRLVVYLMVARDLYDYSQLWKPLETK